MEPGNRPRPEVGDSSCNSSPTPRGPHTGFLGSGRAPVERRTRGGLRAALPHRGRGSGLPESAPGRAGTRGSSLLPRAGSRSARWGAFRARPLSRRFSGSQRGEGPHARWASCWACPSPGRPGVLRSLSQVSELLPRGAGASAALHAARGQSQLLGHRSWGALRADRVTLLPTTPGRAGTRRSPHALPERPRKRNGAVHSRIHTAVPSDPGYPGRGEPPSHNAALSHV